MEDYKSILLNEQIESLLTTIYSTNGVLKDTGQYTVEKATAPNSNLIPYTPKQLKAVAYLLKQELSDFEKYVASDINLYAQRKMITKRGAPHTDQVGVEHQLYRDNVMNYVYYCARVANDGYTWKPLSKGKYNAPELIITSITNARVTATKGSVEIRLNEITSGTYWALLSGTGNWTITVAYGSDAYPISISIPSVRRYLIHVGFYWQGELYGEDIIDAVSVDPVEYFEDEGILQLITPIVINGNDSVIEIELSDIVETFTDNGRAVAAEVIKPVNNDNVSEIDIDDFVSTFTDTVSVELE